MEENEKHLTLSDTRDAILQVGLQAIPVVGSSIAALYFGVKQELRFKRLESFYQEVAEEVDKIKDNLAPPDNHDKESLAAIIEELNDKVEKESLEQKRKYFKTYLLNTLINPVVDNYDERRIFLGTLGNMTQLDCQVLTDLYTSGKKEISKINIYHTDAYWILGAITRLRSYGFIKLTIGVMELAPDIDNALRDIAELTRIGRRFFDFCIRET